jgi:hypothetical protein
MNSHFLQVSGDGRAVPALRSLTSGAYVYVQELMQPPIVSMDSIMFWMEYFGHQGNPAYSYSLVGGLELFQRVDTSLEQGLGVIGIVHAATGILSNYEDVVPQCSRLLFRVFPSDDCAVFIEQSLGL